jgi:glycine betaine/proline transport system substrate-binding protein
MNKFTSKVAAAVLTMTLASVSGQTLAADSTKPIIIPVHNWASQVVMAHVIGNMFESMGNNVEYVPADSQGVYEAIRNGDVTISHEVWQSSFGASFYNAMDAGGVIDVGQHKALAVEEIGVPTWVIDQNLCPGLPSWEALKDCQDVFATTDSGGKGRILEGPSSWHGDVFPNRIEALGLGDQYFVKFAGTGDALWAELAAAKLEGRGTIIFNWSPNWTDAEGFTFLEFPPYYPGCRISEGGTMETTTCGSMYGWLKKAANYKFPKTHPAAYKAFTKLAFTTTDIGQMAALVSVDGMSYEDAGQKWFDDHQDIIATFTD